MRMSVQARSQGDGMEMILNSENCIKKDDFKNFLTRDTQTCSSPFAPSITGKRKEPKFVPYEPYKAAVSHILPKSPEKLPKDKCLSNSNHIKHVVSKLVSNSCENTVNEDLSFPKTIKTSADVITKEVNYEQMKDLENISWLAEKLVLEESVKQLTKDKEGLERQFNIQTKVNADLKKLLVASLGEDMQAKVQYMSEDKAKLGEHVLLFSQKLSENNEELEKLSMQCNMWKKKSESYSLLMDEYAAWKVVLSKKYSESTEAIECLIREHNEMYGLLEETFWTLHHIQEAFDPSAKWNSPCSQSPWNLTQLASATRGLSSGIETRLIGESTCKPSQKSKERIKHGLTYGEQRANEVFADDLSELTKLEFETKRANSIGINPCLFSSKSYSKETGINCCTHCSGEIQLV